MEIFLMVWFSILLLLYFIIIFFIIIVNRLYYLEFPSWVFSIFVIFYKNYKM